MEPFDYNKAMAGRASRHRAQGQAGRTPERRGTQATARRTRVVYSAGATRQLQWGGSGAGGGRRPARPHGRHPRRGRRRGLTFVALVAVAAVVTGIWVLLARGAGAEDTPPLPDAAASLPLAAGAAEQYPGPPWVVALDGGHGGDDVGAIGYISELELIEPTIQKLYALLEADPNFTPVLTRNNGEGKTNTERTGTAVANGAVMLLSLHGNSDGAEATSGFECFPIPPGRAWHDGSLRLARLMAEEFGTTGVRLRGEGGVRYLYFDALGERQIHEQSDTGVYEEQTFGILEKAQYAAVLAEQCFVTNAGDVAAFTGEAGTGLAAECYYRAICRFFEVSPQVSAG